MEKYTNKNGDVFTFTKQEDNNVLWEGNFKYYNHVYGKNQDTILVVEPLSGPYIKKGQMLSHIIGGDEMNVIVEEFEKVETGYLIKTKPHEYDPNDMSHLADSKIIGGIINTTEK